MIELSLTQEKQNIIDSTLLLLSQANETWVSSAVEVKQK